MNIMNNTDIGNKFDSGNILFVSDLARDTSEEDLKDFFKNYHVSSIKLHRGKKGPFAYINFENPDYANRARKDLNAEILHPKLGGKGKPVRICKYEVKTKISEDINNPAKSLIVRNLDLNVTPKEFFKMFEDFGEVKSSKLEVDENNKSKGYGYILFSDEKCAESAKQFFGKKLEVVNLIQSKISDKTHNNIYVKNIPRDFSNEDLIKLFSKYGEISSAVVSRDDKGISKGFGFVCYESPASAALALKEMKEKNLAFPGLPPLYVTYFVKREERKYNGLSTQDRFTGEYTTGSAQNAKFMASFVYDPEINTIEDFDRELRLFIKIVMVQEYFPKKIEINFENKFAIVSMHSMKDLNEFYKKCSEFYQLNFPRFMIQPYVEHQLLPMSYPRSGNLNMNVNNMGMNLSNLPMGGKNMPVNKNLGFNAKMSPMIDQFANMRLNPKVDYKPMMGGNHTNMNIRQANNNFNIDKTGPQSKSTIPGNNAQEKLDHSQKEEDELAYEIYQIVEEKYPDDAGKITGMILDIGLEEMRTLLNKRDKLNEVIDEAYELLHK